MTNRDTVSALLAPLNGLVADHDDLIVQADNLRAVLKVATGTIDALTDQLEDCQSRPTTPASPSGEAMPTGDLPGWRYLMGEDFNTEILLGGFPGAAYPMIGVYPSHYYDTSRNTSRPPAQHGQYNAQRTISVSSSVLRKRLHTEGQRPMVAALLPHIPGYVRTGLWSYQTYGRYSIRSRIRNVMPGYKQAWLLWPQSDDSSIDGEIDFPEKDFNSLDFVGGFVHHAPKTPDPHQRSMGNYPMDLSRWHTYTMEWSPGLVRFIMDGSVLLTYTERIPARPMRWVIQTETAVSSTAPAVSVQGDVEIDWLAMWAYDSAAG